MEYTDLVSVIIPTYNCGKYIERAINSVLSQTYKNFELIIVDDCSTDNTSDILSSQAYSSLENFIVLKNDVNKGVGITRKVGLEKANGKYVTFLDADDYLVQNFLEVNMSLIKQQDSDMTYTSVGLVSPLGQYKVINVGNFFIEGEATLNIFFWSEMNFLTGKMFKTELLRNTKWSEKRIGEDVQTLFYIMYDAKKVRSFPYVGYMHICREGSLLFNGQNQETLTETEKLGQSFYSFCHNCLAEIDMLEFLKERNDEKIYKPMYVDYFNKVKKTREFIKDGTLPYELYLKNKELWDEIDSYYPHEND